MSPGSGTKLIITVLLLLLFAGAFAQLHDNSRLKAVVPLSDTLQLDTLSLVPYSVQITDRHQHRIDTTAYRVDYFHARLRWNHRPPADTVWIRYRVLPFDLTRTDFHKDYTVFRNRSHGQDPFYFYYEPRSAPGGLLDQPGLHYNGSFARGISFGNSQDLVVNSQFNLQMNGALPGGITVNAAITDNNIPIQPEGNTQQLQEFDKVYIQLKKDASSLVVGDFEAAKPEGYFMNYYKKMQGVSFSTLYKAGKNGTLLTTVSGGISKGKFNKQTFAGTEGNQGPYKLTGANGESFLIILAGSEKVYLDGNLMQRGSDKDYVIDYNSGELTFTPQRLITKDSRIQIEFQYSDKNYLRSLYILNQQYKSKALQLHFNVYSEQDNKNKPVQQTLNDTLRLILANAGDSLQRAYYLAVDSVAFDPSKVLYRKQTDPLYGTYYAYSVNPDSAHYQLGFSYVGEGKGNYVLAQSLANGRVYQWVSPLAGVLQGNYEPVVPLVAPRKQLLMTLGGEVQLGHHLSMQGEGAMSNLDVNTFSKLDKADNTGFAGRWALNKDFVLNADPRRGSQVSLQASYEYNDARFNAIDHYRNVEFTRDWNVTDAADRHDEHLATAGLGWTKKNFGNIQYHLSLYRQGTVYQGLNHLLNLNTRWKGFTLLSNSSWLTSAAGNGHTNFIRPSLDFSKSLRALKGLSLGIRGEAEYNKTMEADTLSFTSFYWRSAGAYIKNSDSAKTKLGADYTIRQDALPKAGQFEFASQSSTASAHAAWTRNK